MNLQNRMHGWRSLLAVGGLLIVTLLYCRPLISGNPLYDDVFNFNVPNKLFVYRSIQKFNEFPIADPYKGSGGVPAYARPNADSIYLLDWPIAKLAPRNLETRDPDTMIRWLFVIPSISSSAVAGSSFLRGF
jgi:hypothetical protein